METGILHPHPSLHTIPQRAAAVYQNGIDVSRFWGNINWGRVAAGKQLPWCAWGPATAAGCMLTRIFLQNVSGAKAAEPAVGAYCYTYTPRAPPSKLKRLLGIMEYQLNYPVFVDVEDFSLTSLGRRADQPGTPWISSTSSTKWYAGWYSYTNYINSYPERRRAANIRCGWRLPLDIRLQRQLRHGQCSNSGSVNRISGACDPEP